MRFTLNFRIFSLLIVFVFSILTVQAQTVKELELQRKQTLQNLATTNKMLNETKKSQRSSLTKLNIINKNIKERKVLIQSISSEIGALDSEMNKLASEKRTLENKLSKLKADYVRLVQEAHVKRNMYAKIMFVLSSKSFDQSFRRLRYLQEYTDYRKQQVFEIEKVKVQIGQKNDSLNQHKTTKVVVVKQKEVEAQNLSKDEKKEKVLLTDLKKKEGKLKSDLKVQQKKANDLNNKIERIIAEEIRKAEAKKIAAAQKRAAEQKLKQAAENKRIAAENKRIAEENKRIILENKKIEADNKTRAASQKVSKKEIIKSVEVPRVEKEVAAKESIQSQSVSVLTKEETLLSGDFQRNIGRLPWPTSNGFIRGHFGIQAHPVLKYVTTNNKGVYIQTPSGSTARAVFDGIVSQCFSIPGSNNAVIIKHGNYRTVYANLTQISVREGDRVSAKQTIGRIYTDSENDNKTELYFQVWNGKTLQNPENWISR